MATISTPEPNLLVLTGEIDLNESPAVKEAFRAVLAGKPGRILVDCSGVTYMDSSGLAVLIEAMQRLHATGGKLALFGLRESVRNILHIARLDQVFQIYPDRAAAERE